MKSYEKRNGRRAKLTPIYSPPRTTSGMPWSSPTATSTVERYGKKETMMMHRKEMWGGGEAQPTGPETHPGRMADEEMDRATDRHTNHIHCPKGPYQDQTQGLSPT